VSTITLFTGCKMKIGLFYGTTSAATEEVATLIQTNMANCDVELFDIYKEPLDKINDYENIIIGCPTWDIGLLQEDWRTKFDELENIDFTNKRVAYFGCGDQHVYSGTFLDALGTLEEKITNKGGTTIGLWPVDSYSFDFSLAQKDNNFVGLGIDNDNEPELTEDRVAEWCKQIELEFA
jgi:flavodoxin I